MAAGAPLRSCWEAYRRPQSSIYGNLVHANMSNFRKIYIKKWPEIQEKLFGGRAMPRPARELTVLHRTPSSTSRGETGKREKGVRGARGGNDE